MHVKRVKEGKTEITLNISAVAEDLEPIKQQVLKNLAKDVKVAGFREGKVPLQVAEKNIDPATLQSNFLDEAMTQLYGQAVSQEKIRPTTQPKVDIKKFVPFTSLEFEVTTGVIGEVKLGKYKGLKSTSKARKVTDKDIDKVLDDIAMRMAERVETKRASKKGDEAIISFKGTDDKGQPISGAEGQEYPLTLGSNAFIPGFEDNIIGLKAGDKKEFTLTFPKEYGVKALASKKVTFAVELTKLNELKIPKIDDHLATKVGPFKNLDELKTDVRGQLELEAQNEHMRTMQNELLEQIAKTSSVEVPDQVIDQQVESELQNVRQNLMYRGQTYEEFLNMEGKTDEQYRKEVVRPAAERQVKVGIYLTEIAERENLEVTPEELEMQMQALRAQYTEPQMQAELEKPEARQDIASRILSQKVVDLIIAESV